MKNLHQGQQPLPKHEALQEEIDVRLGISPVRVNETTMRYDVLPMLDSLAETLFRPVDRSAETEDLRWLAQDVFGDDAELCHVGEGVYALELDGATYYYSADAMRDFICGRAY